MEANTTIEFHLQTQFCKVADDVLETLFDERVRREERGGAGVLSALQDADDTDAQNLRRTSFAIELRK